MSLLKELEQRLEALLEGFFTRQFKSGVQPVEIAKKLIREMDGNRTISVSKVYVPNRYTVLLSVEDAEKLKPFEKTLVSELQGFLASHAKKEGYELMGRPSIKLKGEPRLSLGELHIESSLESRDAEPPATGIKVTGTTVMAPKPRPVNAKAAYLVRTGPGGETRFSLTGRSLTIGRSPDNDIVIPDPNVSRRHARIEHTAQAHVLRDLGSTNGTLINGEKVGEHTLHEDDVIVIGTTKLYFRRELGV